MRAADHTNNIIHRLVSGALVLIKPRYQAFIAEKSVSPLPCRPQTTRLLELPSSGVLLAAFRRPTTSVRTNACWDWVYLNVSDGANESSWARGQACIDNHSRPCPLDL